MSVVCQPCSYGSGRDRVQVRHDSIAMVALHSRRPVVVPVVTSVVAFAPEPVVEAPAPVVVDEPLAAGQVRVLGGALWQVRKARGSDRLFGFELVNEPTIDERPEWVYRGMARRVLAGSRLASLDEIRAFGHAVQRCVFCSIQLDDERSRFAGYGETCAGNHGLPWGERPPVELPVV